MIYHNIYKKLKKRLKYYLLTIKVFEVNILSNRYLKQIPTVISLVKKNYEKFVYIYIGKNKFKYVI